VSSIKTDIIKMMKEYMERLYNRKPWIHLSKPVIEDLVKSGLRSIMLYTVVWHNLEHVSIGLSNLSKSRLPNLLA